MPGAAHLGEPGGQQEMHGRNQDEFWSVADYDKHFVVGGLDPDSLQHFDSLTQGVYQQSQIRGSPRHGVIVAAV